MGATDQLPPALHELAASLYQRRGGGVIPLQADARVGGWTPQKHDCVSNVEAWVRANRQYKRVDGFVYFDQGFGASRSSFRTV